MTSNPNPSAASAEAPGPPLALAFGETKVGLFAWVEGETWDPLGEIALATPDFEEQVAALRDAARIVDPTDAPVRIWLPDTQILRRRFGAGVSAPKDLAEATALMAEICNGDMDNAEQDEVVAAHSRDEASGDVTVFGAYRATWEEAQAYARAWGFTPGAVTARDSDARLEPLLVPVCAPAPTAGVEALQSTRWRRVAPLVCASVCLAAVGSWLLLAEGDGTDRVAAAPKLAPAPRLPVALPSASEGGLSAVAAIPASEPAPSSAGLEGSGAVAPPPERAERLPAAPTAPRSPQEATVQKPPAAKTDHDQQPPAVAPFSDRLARLSPSALEALPVPTALPGIRQLRERDLRASPDAPPRPKLRPPVGGLGPPLSPAPNRSPQPDRLRPPALAPTGQDLHRAKRSPNRPKVDAAPNGLTTAWAGSEVPAVASGLPIFDPTADPPLPSSSDAVAGSLLAAVSVAHLGPAPSSSSLLAEAQAPDRAPLPARSAREPVEAVAILATGGSIPPTPPARPGIGGASQDEGEVGPVVGTIQTPVPPARPSEAPDVALGASGAGRPDVGTPRVHTVAVRAGPGEAERRPVDAPVRATTIAFKLPPPKPAPPKGLNLERTVLIGVLSLDGDRTALIRVPTGAFVKVRRGSKLDGWTVGAIGRDILQLTRGSEDRTLTLVRR